MKQNSHNKRHKHFVDRALQNRLVVPLVLLEVLLFAAALFYLYWDMNALIDANLYRIHPQLDQNNQQLFDTVLHVLMWLIAVNVFAVFSAEKFWKKYLEHILFEFQKIIAALPPTKPRLQHQDQKQHDLINIGYEFLERENNRLQALHRLQSDLEKYLDSRGKQNIREIDNTLDQILKLLPQHNSKVG